MATYQHSNDFTVKKPKDLTKVNINNFGELLWWSYNFGISPEKLIAIIQITGDNVKDVKKQLSQSS
ncbi:MAG: DUF3606 domain-containing protein [Chitinophagaceae bacterium]|nr:DUF3606 domain-containing protein [Chitinophagaceae bacterium]